MLLLIYLSYIFGFSSISGSFPPYPSKNLNDTGGVIINEIMYDPEGGEPEWIEIYNSSDSTINLKNYSISDNNNNPVTITTNNLELLPDSFIVVSDKPEILNYYNYSFRLIVVNLPGLNNSGDMVKLYNEDDSCIDSVDYSPSWGGNDGCSLERIRDDGNSNLPTNWTTSTDAQNATPGKRNSAAPLGYDVQIQNIYTSPAVVRVNENFDVEVVLKNTGNNTACSVTVSLYYDLNENINPDSEELLYSFLVDSLITQNSRTLVYRSTLSESGSIRIIAAAEYNEDEQLSNNIKSEVIDVVQPPCGFNDIVINEIMYDPAGGEPEWIELYNNSSDCIDLNDFKVGDRNSYVTITTDSFLICPGSYFVVADNSSLTEFYSGNFDYKAVSFPALNNTGDKVRLLDIYGTIVDSVEYEPDWGGSNGKSLERIRGEITSNLKSNWATSVDSENATPGKKNSVAPLDYDIALTALEFSSLNAYEDSSLNIICIAENLGLKPIRRFNLALRIKGHAENFYEEKFNELAPGNVRYAMAPVEGLQLGKLNVKGTVNSYLDQNYANNSMEISVEVLPRHYSERDLIINEIMFNPLEEEPEWVEIINRSSKSINMLGWKISDEYNSVNILDSSYYIRPGEYLIISDRENIESFYSTIPSDVIKITLPSLNNSDDQVKLHDYHNNQIDFINYNNGWGGLDNISLERISSEANSNSPLNWKPSQSIFRATPGRINSVSAKYFDVSVESIVMKAGYAVYNSETSFEVIIKNEGMANIDTLWLNLYLDVNMDGNWNEGEIILTNSYTEISPDEKLTAVLNSKELHPGKNNLLVKALATGDEYPENNSKTLTVNCVELNLFPGEIIVNEIMFAPDGEEREWIEVYNTTERIISLDGLLIGDSQKASQLSAPFLTIHPEEYLVLTKSLKGMSRYGEKDNFFECDFPPLNNQGDKVILKDTLGRVLEIVEYRTGWGAEKGKSLERINVHGSSMDSLNWCSATCTAGATPGEINSVSEKEYDICLTSAVQFPANPILGEEISLTVELENRGRKNSCCRLNLYINQGAIFESNEICFQPKGSETIQLKNIISCSNKLLLELHVVSAEDQDTSNNRWSRTVAPGLVKNMVAINEVMYKPNNGEPEWIELINNTDMLLPVNCLRISDVLSTPVFTNIYSEKIIMPGEYFVISKDDNILSYHEPIDNLIINPFANLNNSKDGVVIYDLAGKVIDSLFYGGNFKAEQGCSLERLTLDLPTNDSSNWTSSIDSEGSTPGRINSKQLVCIDLAIKEVSINPKYPVVNEQLTINAVVKNNGLCEAENVSITLMSLEEDRPRVLSSSLFEKINSGESLNVEMGGYWDLFETVPVVVEVSAYGDTLTHNNVWTGSVSVGVPRQSIIINEFMCRPSEGKSEWVELLNISDYDINLKSWMISDLSSTNLVPFSRDNDYLLPGEYYIIAKDSLFALNLLNQGIKSTSLYFASLNNSEDAIVIYDSRGCVIDSVMYNAEWPHQSGYSLEKKNPYESLNTPDNWRSSIDITGGTPGRINTSATIVQVPVNSLVINEVLYSPDSFNSEFIELYNTSDDAVEAALCYLCINDKCQRLKYSSHKINAGGYFILTADSVLTDYYSWVRGNGEFAIAQPGFSLPNSGASVVLKDYEANLLDSIYYCEEMNNNNIYDYRNRSLERINPYKSSTDRNNWSTSVSTYGATPLRKNSVYTEILPSSTELTINPNPFSPDNDGFEDFSIISYNLPSPVSRIRLRIYNSQGRLVRIITDNSLSASKGELIFNGLDERGRALPIGIYILLFEASDAAGGSLEVRKTPFVIARKL